MNNFRRLLCKFNKCSRFYSNKNNLYEPDYLEAMKSKIPLYDTLNIRLRGYDYPILESYQKYIHNILKNMDIDVEDAWAYPAQEFNINTYKPKSEIINAQYKLSLYDRVVQITDVSTIELPIFLRILEATTPEGVTAEIIHHQDHHEEDRYIPDGELNKLKDELDEMGGPAKKKNN